MLQEMSLILKDFFNVARDVKFGINPLNANLTKWSNTLKQFVSCFLTNCFSVFDHFVGLALKSLRISEHNFYCKYLPLVNFGSIIDFIQRCIQNLAKHLRWSFFAEIVKEFQPFL